MLVGGVQVAPPFRCVVQSAGMHFKLPKDDAKYHWTQHVGRKMMQYGLSADRVKRVIRAPKRMEIGVALGTVAAMQATGTAKKPWEVWVMYREEKVRKNKNDYPSAGQKVIITAWKYPGTSPIRDVIPLPLGLLAELKSEGLV